MENFYGSPIESKQGGKKKTKNPKQQTNLPPKSPFEKSVENINRFNH